MIYIKDDIYYLKKGSNYEVADLSVKYNRLTNRKALVITGSGVFKELEEPIESISFEELEKRMCEEQHENNR